MNLESLNSLSEQDSNAFFTQCCGAARWVDTMTLSRPFTDIQAIIERAKDVWAEMLEPDLLEAFDAHPMIGDLQSLKDKYRSTLTTASHEQSGANDADDSVLSRLHDLNHAYLAQNGFIFIICASGLSAEKMLAELEVRITHSREQELVNASQQQINITLLRLNKQLTHNHKAISSE